MIVDCICCAGCGAKFPSLLGVPFLATYRSEDVVRLIETLAHLEIAGPRFLNPANVERSPFPPGEALYKALRLAWEGEDDSVALEAAGMAEKPWWWNSRRSEYQTFSWLTGGFDFSSKTVVDVGAGSGMDAMLYHNLGAKVIAIEPDFVTLADGLATCPQLHWLGAVAEALPLASDCADFVVANASLHHHHDLAISFPEMLRVLRVGGSILTIGDPFKASSSIPPEEDYAHFDTHAYVLRGINEQVLRLDKILSLLKTYDDSLSVRIYLDLPERPSKSEITIEEAEILVSREPAASGSVALCVTKLKPLTLPSPVMACGAFPPSELLEAVIGCEGGLFRFVDALVTDSQLTTDLFITQNDRWLQLNGWRMMQPCHPALRLAYGSGRLFMPLATASPQHLNLEWMVPDCGPASDVEIELRLNGSSIRRVRAARGVWNTWTFPVSKGSGNLGHLCVELGLPRFGWPEDDKLTPENHIAVRHLSLGPAPVSETSTLSAEPSLAALMESLRQRGDLRILCGPDVDSAMSALRALRCLQPGIPLSVFAYREQFSFFSAVSWLITTSTPAPACTQRPDEPPAFTDKPLLLVGFARGAISSSRQDVWWLDGDGRPFAASDLHATHLRDSLGELRLDAATKSAHRLSTQLNESILKANELRAKLAEMRAQRQKLQDKVATLKGKQIRKKRGSLVSRLIKHLKGSIQ